MEVILRPTREAAEALAARLIAEQVRAKPDSVLGLATGGTMERVYAELVRLHVEEELDFSLVRTFNLDEYVGLPGDHVCSYRYYMDQHLFRGINIDSRNTHLPNGVAEDLAAECRAYEEAITRCGGIDLQLLGIGKSGHIGFNEPLSALRSRTREKALSPVTMAQNAGYFSQYGPMPQRGLTMGVGTILDARDILLLVTGEAKADVLARAVEGPVTSMISASALQLHAHCRVIVDEAAATQLSEQEYYRWIFDHEPEWEPYR